MIDKSETRFREICLSKKYEIVHATKEQDIYEHWDWQITNPKTKKVSLVDVKGAREKKPF